MFVKVAYICRIHVVKCVNQTFNEVKAGAKENAVTLLWVHNALDKLKCCVVRPVERPELTLLQTDPPIHSLNVGGHLQLTDPNPNFYAWAFDKCNVLFSKCHVSNLGIFTICQKLYDVRGLLIL